MHTGSVARLESFRALKLTLLESFRALKSQNPIGEFQGPKCLKIGELQGPNTHPIGDFQGPICYHPNGELQGFHPTHAYQVVLGPTPGLEATDKWMMVTNLAAINQRWSPSSIYHQVPSNQRSTLSILAQVDLPPGVYHGMTILRLGQVRWLVMPRAQADTW